MATKSTKRAKRRVRFAYRAMDRGLMQLLALIETFEPDHADYAEFLDLIARALLKVQAQLGEFHKLAWGREPSNWYQDP